MLQFRSQKPDMNELPGFLFFRNAKAFYYSSKKLDLYLLLS